MNSEAKGFRNTNADDLVMLLSIDWFLPYWGSTIGLSLDEDQKKFVQQGCRCIVDQLIDGAEQYYLIAFTLERIERTRDEFWKLLAKAGVDEEVLSRTRELLSPDPQTGGTRWLLTLNTKMLVQGSRDLPVGDTVPELDPEIREALRDWNFRQPQRIDVKDACMKSASSWDAHIRNLTPELPASLADHAQVEPIGELQFRDLLRTIADLSAGQKMNSNDGIPQLLASLSGPMILRNVSPLNSPTSMVLRKA